MKIITTGERAGARVIALGTFDGVHRGHQELIRTGKRLAEEIGAGLRVCTFDRHPLEVLRPEAAPKLLETGEEQAARLASLGADELRVIPFTRDTAETEPGDFLRALETECDVAAAVVGWNYTFGRKGSGTPETLRREGEARGFRTLILPPVRTEEGEIISSTAIRERLTRGDLEGANRMLGYDYEISGTVVEGKHMGTRIGFPTVNIDTDGRKQLPAFGVYLCRLESGGDAWNAVVNIGNQPTIPSGRVTVEAHALDASLNLYGRRARVRLIRRLRPEKRFETIDGLIDQITQDRKRAADFFAKTPPSACQAPENTVY